MAGLTSEEHAIVTEAVGEAEKTTSGEIVTVIADRSDGYSDIALAWSAAFAFLVLTLFAVFPSVPLDPLSVVFDEWNHDWTEGEVFAVASSLGIVAFALAYAVQLWDPLRFRLIPGKVRTERALDRAVELFKVGAERRTVGRTGVLIYLSLKEHRAEIVADTAIASKVSDEVWGEAMADMLAEIKQGRIAHGMAAGVRDVGNVLSQHFPRADDDVNELPDRLIEL